MNIREENIKLLINQCLKHNTSAQNKLFNFNYSFVFSICRRYSKNDENAKEMLNDTFYRCFKKLDKYDSQYPFQPWLRKLCVNCCLRYLEKYAPKINYESRDWSDEKFSNDFQVHLPPAKDLNYLRYLDQLPPSYKMVMNLFVIEGYKHHEIAEKLNISVGASKSNLHRAKRLMYTILEKEGKVSLHLKTGYGR